MASDLIAKRDAMAKAFANVAESLRAAAMAVDAFSFAMPDNKGAATTAANGIAPDKVKKEKKEKKVRDPNAPKPPVGAYLLYSGNVREKVRMENPTLSSHEVAALIGKMWNDAGEKEKTPYTSIYEADKARYNAQMKEYTDYMLQHGNSEGFVPSTATKPKVAAATAPTPESDDESSDMEVTAALKAAPTPKSTKKAATTPASSSKKRSKDEDSAKSSVKKKSKKATDAVKDSEDTPSKKKKKEKTK